MRHLVIGGLLMAGIVGATPAAAQSVSWSGSRLTVLGQSVDGCNLRITNITWNGGNALQMLLSNGTPGGRYVRASIRVTAPNGAVEGGLNETLVPGGGSQTRTAVVPNGSDAVLRNSGSSMQVTFTKCGTNPGR